MLTALFTAGLGDVIRTIYQTAAYRAICQAAEPLPVIVASHNPFTLEIFQLHRNAGNFILLDLARKYEEFFTAGLRGPDINRALCQFAGVDYGSIIRGDAEGHVPVFDAPDDIASSGHIVFQPFAGSMSARSFDDDLIERVVRALREQPHPVYLITRSYIRKGVSGQVIHAEEDARRFAGGNITVLENLSVPASLNLVKTCRAYIGSWSSLHQAAWFEHKPVAVYYPVNYVDVVNRTGYAFGIDRPDCLHAEFPSADMARLREWVAKW